MKFDINCQSSFSRIVGTISKKGQRRNSTLEFNFRLLKGIAYKRNNDDQQSFYLFLASRQFGALSSNVIHRNQNRNPEFILNS